MTSTRQPSPKRENLSLFLALIANDGLPAPETHVTFAKPRRWALDLAWREWMVACEVEGGVWTQGRHTRGSGFIGDMEKYNTAAIMGWLLVRVTYDMIADGTAVATVRRALVARGWGIINGGKQPQPRRVARVRKAGAA